MLSGGLKAGRMRGLELGCWSILPRTPGDIPALNTSVALGRHRGCWTLGGGWGAFPTASTLWPLRSPLLPQQDWGFLGVLG